MADARDDIIAGRSRVRLRRTIARVLAVQLVTLLLLWTLQDRFGL
jgi:hypothetical protein